MLCKLADFKLQLTKTLLLEPNKNGLTKQGGKKILFFFPSSQNIVLQDLKVLKGHDAAGKTWERGKVWASNKLKRSQEDQNLLSVGNIMMWFQFMAVFFFFFLMS